VIDPVNDPPVLVNNGPASVNEGGSITITNTLLLTTDVDHAPNQLTYTLTLRPVNGTLLKNGNPIPLGGTFTQQDITDGLIVYEHDGSETTSDLFQFTVEDAAGASPPGGPFTFNITVIPVNDPPVVGAIFPNPVNLVEDSFAVPVQVLITGIDPVEPGQIILSVNANTSNASISGPVSVTYPYLADPTQALIEFVPPANAFGSANLLVTIQDNGGGSDTSTIIILVNISPVNDPPTLVNNNPLTVNEGGTGIITSTLLLATDVDNPVGQIIYELATLPSNGRVLLNGTPLNVGDTFTQADINASRVRYQHNGSETLTDSFTFNLRDANGASGGSFTFSININPINDPPSVDLNGGASGVDFTATFNQPGPGSVFIVNTTGLTVS
jgi:hypothetical protein